METDIARKKEIALTATLQWGRMPLKCAMGLTMIAVV